FSLGACFRSRLRGSTGRCASSCDDKGRGMARLNHWIAAWLTVLIASAGQPVLAQDFPTRSVRIVVPFPAGGTADALPRIVGEWLARKWGQAVVIENRPGAGGNLGAEVVANAEPDGYTLLSSPPPPLVINQNLYSKLGFDPAAFVPISVMAIVPTALVVNP